MNGKINFCELIFFITPKKYIYIFLELYDVLLIGDENETKGNAGFDSVEK